MKKMPSMGYLLKKTLSTDVFERLTKKHACNHDHEHGVCPHQKQFLLNRNRRQSKSWHTSPINMDSKAKTATNFSKLLDTTNEEGDEKRMQSMVDLDREDRRETCENCVDDLNFHSHKDYLIGKLCEKLRKLNFENRSLNIRIDKLEQTHIEFSTNVMRNSERLENDLATLGKERISLRMENSKEVPQSQENSKVAPEENHLESQKESSEENQEPNEGNQESQVEEVEQKSDRQNKEEEVQNGSENRQKQEKAIQPENHESYEVLIYRLKSLEMERNKYYEQLITVQKKNEAFFIENSELFRTNQKLLAENEALHSRLLFLGSTASLKKKSSPIFKSIFTNESTIETEDEDKFAKHSPNDEIIKDVITFLNFCSFDYSQY